VPPHLLVQALVCGGATLLVCAPTELAPLAGPLAIVVAIDALMILAELHGRHASEAASRARRLLTTGQRRNWLYGGSLFLGHLLPIILLTAGGSGAALVGSLLAAVGVAIYEHLWVDAPQRLPLA
jgi:hypothetical protein